MRVEDIDTVYLIETHSFASPWNKESFYNEVAHNLFATYLVAELNGEVIGYCGIWLIVDEAQVTNIAILPEYRGNGFGEILLRQAMKEAKRRGARQLSLEVRVSNHPAQSLYRKLGFQPGGIRKQYYTDNLEDALVMWVMLNGI
ncbi:ribosomal-protein-alanine N-acetyltransferase [Bacillus mangrovi]|uniref:[Ribosomal protein bS18]-alanine N-acetyltransferase n=2 Tax=Metabacillus mangrovi TaxID=1491830 RepID=A0A7X2V6Y1_9BACI|nr:ribosomal protein S18-alanine N-acetyltransferase [Metabacillus mangrovi]MTH55576.1 ribosomal-protein-alanine N-acetyltransferase [Metabacillus mangrovi]